MGKTFPHDFGVTESVSESQRGKAPMERTSEGEDEGPEVRSLSSAYFKVKRPARKGLNSNILCQNSGKS